MMRKIALTASLALLAIPLHVSAETIIKLGTIAPEQSVWHDALLEIRQQWRRISRDEVELRIYAGGVLGGEDEMVRKMQRRGLDALAISGSGLPLIDSIVSCLNVPMLFSTYEELARVRLELAADFDQSFERRGFKVLGWAEAGWIRFFAKAPVRRPEDLMKQRLWTSTGDPDGERLLNEFGFRVVALPVTDMLTGLQTGLIEAIDVPPLFALLDRSFQEAEYMTMLNFAPLNAAIVVSMQAWNRIPADYRPELEAAVEQAVVGLRQRLHQAEDEAVEEMIGRGLQAVELNADEFSAWQDLATSVYPALACNREFPELFQKMLSLVQK